MKTREVLLTPEQKLAPILKTMKQKELERHAKKILSALGCDNFDAVMLAVIKAVPKVSAAGGDRFQAIQAVIAEKLSETQAITHAANDDASIIAGFDRAESLLRVSVLVMMLITKKFDQIMQEQ